MNCKPGELAIIVRGPMKSAIGCILKIIAPYGVVAPKTPFMFNGVIAQSEHGGFLWRTEGKYPFCPDAILKPIRPDLEEEDEQSEVQLQTEDTVSE